MSGQWGVLTEVGRERTGSRQTEKGVRDLYGPEGLLCCFVCLTAIIFNLVCSTAIRKNNCAAAVTSVRSSFACEIL